MKRLQLFFSLVFRFWGYGKGDGFYISPKLAWEVATILRGKE